MMNDFEKFVQACKSKKINAVLCTLAPLPYFDGGNRKDTLEGFNRFLKTRSGLSVIDINKVFSEIRNEAYNLNCYMDQPRRVSGAKKAVTLWSNYGIQEFGQAIKKKAGFALVSDSPLVL
jgi:hypothetical protein